MMLDSIVDFREMVVSLTDAVISFESKRTLEVDWKTFGGNYCLE